MEILQRPISSRVLYQGELSMNNIVYVVTSLELGWDCVVGVFKDVDTDKLQKIFPSPPYVISEMTVETNLGTWEEA